MPMQTHQLQDTKKGVAGKAKCFWWMQQQQQAD
jgi:hypothetical protein